MLLLIALFPIIFALLLMTRFKVSPGKALPAAWLLTMLAAKGIWQMRWSVIFSSSLYGVLKGFDIIFIIFGAVFLLNILRESGAVRSINGTFSHLSGDRRIQVIIIAWIFSAFIEGAAGFGAAPALAAPLLWGMGFPAVTAAAVALICNTLPVPFGAVGTPVLTCCATLENDLQSALLSPLRFSHELLDQLTGIFAFSGIFLPLTAIAVMLILERDKHFFRSLAEIAPLALISGAAYVIPWRYAALWFGPELPSMLGAPVAFAVVMLCIKTGFLIPKRRWDFSGAVPMGNNALPPTNETKTMPVWQAWLPYGVIALILLLTRLPGSPLKSWLPRLLVLRLPPIAGVPGTGFTFPLLGNPGIFPFLLTALAFAGFRSIPLKKTARILGASCRQIAPAAIAIAASVALVQVMIFSRQNPAGIPGMLRIIADTAANRLGRGFFIISPFLGILGTFFAGSCTVSNILFASLQFDTAQVLGMRGSLLVALQNVGGGLGSMIRLSGLVAACTMVKANGQEGKILLICLGPAILLALLSLLGAWLLY